MANAKDSVGLTPEEVEVFARGLYHLASVDGIVDRERELIVEFLREAGSELSLDELGQEGFSPAEAALLLQTSYLRRIFVRTAIALVKSDGKFTEGERHALGEIADAFQLSNADFGDLERSAEGLTLD